jgi:L-ascorbate metabolism protein UlaG (beta-lactamase superfamily)
MKLTYYGHSCFSVHAGGSTLLFDPFITPNELAKSIDVQKVAADFIFITHAHADHMADAVDIAKRTGAPVITNFEIAQWLEREGVADARGMNHGGSAEFGFGRVKFTTAIHSSSFPDGRYAGNPGGFVVSTNDGTFYYSGDTALTMDMKLIGDEFELDFAVLPIGDRFTMGAKDAARAAEFVGCNRVVGVHYDTFPPIEIDPGKAVGTFEEAGRTLLLPKIGETIDL